MVYLIVGCKKDDFFSLLYWFCSSNARTDNEWKLICVNIAKSIFKILGSNALACSEWKPRLKKH